MLEALCICIEFLIILLGFVEKQGETILYRTKHTINGLEPIAGDLITNTNITTPKTGIQRCFFEGMRLNECFK